MKAWIVVDNEGNPKGISNWGAYHAWNRAIFIEESVKQLNMSDAVVLLKRNNWKCEIYNITKEGEENE